MSSPWIPSSCSYPGPIGDERRRQIAVEGWSESHDDQYVDGDLVAAAGIYFDSAKRELPPGVIPPGWPWGAQWFKPKSALRDAVRGGALCLAEIDRLRRAGRSYNHVVLMLSEIEKFLAKEPPDA